MTPVYYDNSDYQGEPHYLYFIVQSKGFFTPGFEFGMLLFAIIFISILKNSEIIDKTFNSDFFTPEVFNSIEKGISIVIIVIIIFTTVDVVKNMIKIIKSNL